MDHETDARSTLLLFHHWMLEHAPGPDHPERPGRLHAILEALHHARLPHIRWNNQPPHEATRRQLRAVHTPEHVLRMAAMAGTGGRIDADTVLGPGSHRAALTAAGTCIAAVDAVLAGEAANAFALVRPPGHHAEPDRAMGFCIFNSVAVAAAHAIEARGLERVLIVDWDVHHGNGTQRIFEDRSDVLFISTHQWPLYPRTGGADEIGHGDGEGFTVNLPVPAGTSDEEMLAVYGHLVEPIADAYRPQLVLISAGFDADARDPLANLNLTPAGFAAMLRMLRRVADRHAGGRIVLALEGGYDLDALAEGVLACLMALEPEPGLGPRIPDLPRHLEPLRTQHAARWPVLRG